MIIDALQCGHFNRESFEALRRGGYSAVTPTLGFWEGTMESRLACPLARHGA